MHQLYLVASRENFERFAIRVGSSIARKRRALLRIVGTYVVDLSEAMRTAQKKGAATRRARTFNVTIPRVVRAIRRLIDRGNSPTSRACVVIAGFHTAVRHFTKTELVEKAMRLRP